MDARGRVLTPLDEAATGAAVAALLAAGCESLVIHFLHSYANPAHERRAAGDRRRDLAERATITMGHALLSESARVRARRHRGGQRRGAADPRTLCRPASGRAAHARLPPRVPDHERQWRHDLGALRRARGGQDRDVGAGLGRDRRRLYRPARRLRRSRHLRHGRHLDRRRADPRRRAAVSNEIEIEYAHADPRADGGRAHGRRRRRLDRAGRRLGPDPGRPGKRRAPSPARSATAAAAQIRRSPTPTCSSAGSTRDGCSPTADAVDAGHLRGEPRRRRSASTRRRRPARCSGSATSRWPARSAWSRCRAATIRATSRSSPSAAPGRCTPRRWRASSACPRCWCRRGRASPTRWAASWPTSATISSTP